MMMDNSLHCDIDLPSQIIPIVLRNRGANVQEGQEKSCVNKAGPGHRFPSSRAP